MRMEGGTPVIGGNEGGRDAISNMHGGQPTIGGVPNGGQSDVDGGKEFIGGRPE